MDFKFIIFIYKMAKPLDFILYELKKSDSADFSSFSLKCVFGRK